MKYLRDSEEPRSKKSENENVPSGTRTQVYVHDQIFKSFRIKYTKLKNHEIFVISYILDNQHELIDSGVAIMAQEMMRLIQHEYEEGPLI